MADPGMSELDELNQELARVQDDLLALPDDAFEARYRLQKRQDELREQAAAYHQDRDARRSSAELIAELAALRGQLEGIYDQQINLVSQAGGGTAAGPGADGYGGVGANQAIFEAQGGNRVRARIDRIRGILSDRGIDPDE